MLSFLAVALAAVLMITSVPVQVFAAGEENMSAIVEEAEPSVQDSVETDESTGTELDNAESISDSAAEPDNEESISDSAAEPDNEESISNSATAPDNYVTKKSEEKISSEKTAKTKAKTEETKRVLLIQDTEPWNSDANEVVLNNLGYDYDLVGTRNFLNVDLTQYGVVIFANDQAFDAYENYKEFKEYLELFAELGGVIVFGASDNGWANGNLSEELPGGVS